MDKIPFAENLADCLPKYYGKNLAEMNEIQLMAMQEDNRRWHECEERYKAVKFESDYVKKRKASEDVAKWLGQLNPFAYREDMRRRMNHLREKYKVA